MSDLSTALGPIIHLFAKAVAHELRPTLESATAETAALRRELESLKAIVEERASIQQIPSSGTCWTCTWFGGKICQRHGSPHYHKNVKPTDSCEKYLQTENPRGEIIKKVGAPDGNQPIRRREVKCDRCGNLVRLTKTGRLFKHDKDGHIYTGLSGDKERPCLSTFSKTDMNEGD